MTPQPIPKKILSVMSRKLGSAYRYIRTRMADEGLEGMDVSHGDILWQLYARGPRTMGELAAGIGRDKSTVTALVGKMESRGLVRRLRDTPDARVITVALTPKGEAFRDPFNAISAEIMTILWSGFSAEEKETLARLMDRLGEADKEH